MGQIFKIDIHLDFRLYIVIFFMFLTDPASNQDSLRPYPWPRHRSRSRTKEMKPEIDNAGSMSTDTAPVVSPVKPPVSSRYFDDTSMHCCHDFLDYMLPPKGALAGRVLQHAKATMATLFSKHEPMIFKIGYSHNVYWRWSNSLYGYKLENAKWEKMVVLHQSEESAGCAMLEACLIDIYKGILASSPLEKNLKPFTMWCQSQT